MLVGTTRWSRVVFHAEVPPVGLREIRMAGRRNRAATTQSDADGHDTSPSLDRPLGSRTVRHCDRSAGLDDVTTFPRSSSAAQSVGDEQLMARNATVCWKGGWRSIECSGDHLSDSRAADEGAARASADTQAASSAGETLGARPMRLPRRRAIVLETPSPS
jgi:hypothetical protein